MLRGIPALPGAWLVSGLVYDVATGAVLVDPFGIDPPQGNAAPLSCYPTRLVDGMVEVDLPGTA